MLYTKSFGIYYYPDQLMTYDSVNPSRIKRNPFSHVCTILPGLHNPELWAIQASFSFHNGL